MNTGKISITDDFSLSKIADSGQCFRVKRFPSGMFRFVYRNSVLYITELSPTRYEISCSMDEWNDIWHPYFDLDTDYARIRAGIPRTDTFLSAAADAAKGVRVLRQDPFEMLITFIISQRKNIPAIKNSVELLCASCGRPCRTGYEDIFLFPDAESMLKLSTETLTACKLGYRTSYVEDAVWKVSSGELDLLGLEQLSDSEVTEKLKTVRGVGDKVANCISLFGYHRTASAPVDVWIRRVIDQYYGGENPFPAYGETAGIMQQFMFWYMQDRKSGAE